MSGTARLVTVPVRGAGELVAFALDTAWAAATRLPAWRELLRQLWFVAGAATLPAVCVGAALGAVAAVQVGALAGPVAPPDAPVLGALRYVAPLLTALVVAVTGGSAVCAQIAARAGNGEIEALELVGAEPLRRLAVPAVAAVALVTGLLNGLVASAAVGGWYLVWPDARFAPTASFAGALEALGYGLVIGMVAAHRGFSAQPPDDITDPPRAARVGSVVARCVGASILAVLLVAVLLVLVRGVL